MYPSFEYGPDVARSFSPRPQRTDPAMRSRAEAPRYGVPLASFTGVGSPLIETDTETETKLGDLWNVVVLNDPVNLMSYVSMVFQRVLGMSKQEAEKRMMEVHEVGRSVVWTGEREKAETFVYQLQEWHLQAILERNEVD